MLFKNRDRNVFFKNIIEVNCKVLCMNIFEKGESKIEKNIYEGVSYIGFFFINL